MTSIRDSDRYSSDLVFYGEEYIRGGDRSISTPPLIDTSLFKLCNLDWRLHVTKRVLPRQDGTKLKYQFRPPPASNPTNEVKTFLTFRKFVKRLVWERSEVLGILLSSDLTPNFTRQPNFTLRPESGPVVKVQDTVYREVEIAVPVHEDELTALERINRERVARIGTKYLPVIEEEPLPPLVVAETAKILNIADFLPLQFQMEKTA